MVLTTFVCLFGEQKKFGTLAFAPSPQQVNKGFMKKLVLSIVALASVGTLSAQDDLILSEVVEGSGNNKGFEVFNPSDQPINLSDYAVKRYNNGALTPSGGTLMMDNVDLQPGDVWVMINGQTTDSPQSPACDPAMQALADQLGGDYPDPCYNNGNDAVTIEKLVSTNPDEWVIIDLFGKIGEDPGTAWSDQTGKWWTANHTLIRKPNVKFGVTTNPAVFDVTLEWDTLPQDTWDSLGTHYVDYTLSAPTTAEQASEVYIFPNPANGPITIKATDRIVGVRIYNMTGQQVYQSTNAYSGMQLDVADFRAGLYLAEVELRNGAVLTRKISLR